MSTGQNNKISTKFKLFGIALTVKDIDESVLWYENVLGFVLLSKTDFKAINAKGAFLVGLGIRLELLQSDMQIRLDEMFAEPPKHIYPIGNKSMILSVESLHNLSSQLEGKDITVLWKNLVINDEGMRNTMLQDIDGNFISIFEKQR